MNSFTTYRYESSTQYIFQIFNNIYHDKIPNIYSFNDNQIKLDILENLIKKYFSDLNFTEYTYTNIEDSIYKVLVNTSRDIFIGYNILFNNYYIFENYENSNFEYTDSITLYYIDKNLYIDNIIKFFNELKNNKLNIFEEDNKPVFDIIYSKNNNYDIIEQEMTKYMTDIDLEYHYPDNFIEFDKSLQNKILKSSKGIILLYGIPGSGKTTYIRYLISKLYIKKQLLVIPSGLLKTFSDPAFMPFLINYCNNSETIIIIEDGEKLISDNRNNEISMLLNMGDGLFNDILNVQFIITFNKNINNIDNAILRPERLIAQKEFTKLSYEKSLKLLKYKDYQKNIVETEYSIAELYSLINSELY